LAQRCCNTHPGLEMERGRSSSFVHQGAATSVCWCITSCCLQSVQGAPAGPVRWLLRQLHPHPAGRGCKKGGNNGAAAVISGAAAAQNSQLHGLQAKLLPAHQPRPGTPSWRGRTQAGPGAVQ
jgi:hypothetical protein